MAASEKTRAEASEHKCPRSLFDLPPDFFDSCRLLFQSSHTPPPSSTSDLSVDDDFTDRMEESLSLQQEEVIADSNKKGVVEAAAAAATAPRWTCNTCRSEFDSLLDQRSHFKSDLHRLNVKLNIAGKKTIKEEDFDEFEGDPLFENIDVSSISGSEDELEKVPLPNSDISGKGREGGKQKLYFHLHSGEMISIWRSLIMDESEDLSLENWKSDHVGHDGGLSYVEEAELINRLKFLVREPRDKKHTRIVLLVSGGHFAGCVFDGNTVVAHKTFHRYVVRAKAGKKQSSKDATGRAAHSAGSALRRYNEAALKKDIQELLISWKTYIDSSSCIFVYAPAKNRQMLFDMDNPQSGLHNHIVRNLPLTVRRPTLKEAKRVYNHLTLMTLEIEAKSIEEVTPSCENDEGNINQHLIEKQLGEKLVIEESSSAQSSSVDCMLGEGENFGLSTSENETTPLHEAAKSGDVQRTLELLEEGLNPCLKDARGRTPYMVATEKEVRNTFRRYMASNPDKWDWHVANVPSPLTKEMEESQAAKQAEKDAKRKAKAKELKKLQKAKEKAKSQAAQSQGPAPVPVSTAKQTPQSNRGIVISKEEEQRRALEAEREKRAAAAEKRIAALNAQKVPATAMAITSCSEPKPTGVTNNVICSCCNASLAGKIPFHRYNYKYCSTTCMHVHREMLEDG